MQRKEHEQPAGVKRDAVEILTDRQERGIRYVVARGPLATWTMEQAGDDDPVFPSRALARSLGMARERNLHHLTHKLYPTERELSLTSSAKVVSDENIVHYRLIPSGGGRPIKEYLYSRRQVLKLTMRSETKEADAKQNELVEILLMVRRAASAGITEARFKILLEEARSGDRKQIEDLREEMNLMRALLESGVIDERERVSSLIGTAEARELTDLAKLIVDGRTGTADKRARKDPLWKAAFGILMRDAERHVAGVCGYRWAHMTVGQAGRMRQYLAQKLCEESRRGRRRLQRVRRKAQQGDLFSSGATASA